MPEPMELAYEERGSGPALVLIHGFPFNSTMWIEQLKGLAKIRRACAVDLRGHGYSKVDDLDGFSMDLFADDVAKTLDDIGADQVDVMGLSMGGYVALAMWRRHRDRIRSIILADTKAEADSDEAKAGRDKVAAMLREKGDEGIEQLANDLTPKLTAPNPSAEVVDHIRRMILTTPPEVAAADAIAMRDRPDSTPDLAEITMPVLWIQGEQDALMPPDSVRAAAGKIPNGRFETVPNGGHVSPMENPAEANKIITAFLNEVTPPKKK
jgi:pimeloyl-ACP methyl ester carboxylesterase